MSFSAVRQTLWDAFQTEFALAHPTVPVHFENTKFKTPSNSWVFVAILPGDSVRKEISSSKLFEHYGAVNVSCMVPEGKGTDLLHEISETVFNILADRNWNLGADGYLTTKGAIRRNRGEINGFYTFNVLCEYCHTARLVR